MKKIGKLIHTVDIKLKRRIDRLADSYGLTTVQFIVMEWIYLLSKKQDVFQKDLEAVLDVRRSTISNVLGILEQKGYILRESVPADARLKKLSLTASGEEIYLGFESYLMQNEAEDFQIFSPEERELLVSLLERLGSSLK